MCVSLSNKNRIKASCFGYKKKEKQFCDIDEGEVHKSCALFTHKKKRCAKGLIKKIELYMVRYCSFECSGCDKDMKPMSGNNFLSGTHACNKNCQSKCKSKTKFNLKYYQHRVHKINKSLGLSRFEKLDELKRVDVIKLKNDIKKAKRR